MSEMAFEDFEKNIQERGYSIVGMNHYYQDGKCYTFCAILNATTGKAFKVEHTSSERVFYLLQRKVELEV